MSKKSSSVFNVLFNVNVGNHIEKKNGLSYLSWPYAWAETKKLFPEAKYEVKLFGENNLPYIYDEITGYMVFTSITIEELTHEMWLPVMDSANKTMRSVKYTYDTKYKKSIPVEPATMFDINKTIMRCLVKNLAMFGLGLYIYSGEDLPEIEAEKIQTSDATSLKKLIQNFETPDKLHKNILKTYGIKNLEELNLRQYNEVLEKLNQWQKDKS